MIVVFVDVFCHCLGVFVMERAKSATFVCWLVEVLINIPIERASADEVEAIMTTLFDNRIPPSKFRAMLQDKYGPQACLMSCVLCLVSCPVLSCRVLSCLVFSCLVLSCLVFA